MERLQAFKFELRPTGEQMQKLRQFGGACRFVYNRALALQLAVSWLKCQPNTAASNVLAVGISNALA